MIPMELEKVRKGTMQVEYEGCAQDGEMATTLDARAWTKAGLAVELDLVALQASNDDNVAIATVELEAGTVVKHRNGSRFEIKSRVLEGHRFAVEIVPAGGMVRSWGMRFGKAVRNIDPGEYVCNSKACNAMKERGIWGIPEKPNFEDFAEPFKLEDVRIAPERHALMERKESFGGFVRQGNRGTGTRNYLVIFGLTNQTASVSREIAKKLDLIARGIATMKKLEFDGVVPVCHTESGNGNNAQLVRRTLSGMLTHPNIAGAVLVAYEDCALNADALLSYMESEEGKRMKLHEKLKATPYFDIPLAGKSFESDVDEAVTRIEAEFLARVLTEENCQRTTTSVNGITAALQCGGSDAFSGITANPLLGDVAKSLVSAGGSAVLAETDELIGAESYVLQSVRSQRVAEKFIEMTERIKSLLSWHGVSAEGNPSGGNLLRGLYNISIKSLGAATKKPVDVPLEGVLDYSEPITEENGYYFMHSPGNDLESVAGQVASGCNIIFFTTGNGSITNFPFVPTIKIVSTTTRYKLLEKDMDFDAGRLSGQPLAFNGLSRELFALMKSVCGGVRSKGELANHSQVSIWRDWVQTGPESIASFCNSYRQVLRCPVREIPCEDLPFANMLAKELCKIGPGAIREQRIGLVLPTSLCSSEVGRILAERLNGLLPLNGILEKTISLSHSEGCGSNYGDKTFGHDLNFPESLGAALLDRVLLGHLAHPLVRGAILLEHGCEMNHNIRMKSKIDDLDIQQANLLFGSVQLDGGIEAVLSKCLGQAREKGWFDLNEHKISTPSFRKSLRIAMVSHEMSIQELSIEGTSLIKLVAAAIIRSGGNLVTVHGNLVPAVLFGTQSSLSSPTLRFADSILKFEMNGYVFEMENITDDWVETISGLASSGVDAILVFSSSSRYLTTHPFAPMVVVGNAKISDVVFPLGTSMTQEEIQGKAFQIIETLIERTCMELVRERQQSPSSLSSWQFQIPRGPIGVSV